jgi:hypothetical protein
LWADKPLRRLLAVPFGGDIPDDIREKIFKLLVRCREDLRKRSGLYDKHRPLVIGVNCRHSFPLDVTTGERACFCFCEKAKLLAKKARAKAEREAKARGRAAKARAKAKREARARAIAKREAEARRPKSARDK